MAKIQDHSDGLIVSHEDQNAQNNAAGPRMNVCTYIICNNSPANLADSALSYKLLVGVTNFTRLPAGWKVFSKRIVNYNL